MTMRKTVKLLVSIVVFMCTVGIAGILMSFSFGSQRVEPDIIAVNDLAMKSLEEETLTAEQITNQILLLYDRMDAEQQTKDSTLKIWLCLLIALIGIMAIVILVYADRRILRPFARMKQFAGQIAAGNLDTPLDMNRGGGFGAYTESLDLMRSELKRAREAEVESGRSKKELIASLSHDVKTPVASIRAVAELMSVTCNDDKQQKQIGTILEKSNQISRLVDGMFKATLEELQELEVNPCEITGTEVNELIQAADYAGKAVITSPPDCVVVADTHRLSQVFDNIISNSYKYAETNIRVESTIEDIQLILRFTDNGGGAPHEELPLLTQKFYRGGNSWEKDGAGLGLYISAHLIERMGGMLSVDNTRDGFMVQIVLKLA